jgi:hypothetical protein
MRDSSSLERSLNIRAIMLKFQRVGKYIDLYLGGLILRAPKGGRYGAV